MVRVPKGLEKLDQSPLAVDGEKTIDFESPLCTLCELAA
jgi:hypothetical protein